MKHKLTSIGCLLAMLLLLGACMKQPHAASLLRQTDSLLLQGKPDVQLCILIKLGFSISQIAVFTAVSSTSVSQQKSRMKKRILAVDSCLFGEGETLDSWLYEL